MIDNIQLLNLFCFNIFPLGFFFEFLVKMGLCRDGVGWGLLTCCGNLSLFLFSSNWMSLFFRLWELDF